MKFRKGKEGKSKQSDSIKLGLAPNIWQFLILVLVNASRLLSTGKSNRKLIGLNG